MLNGFTWRQVPHSNGSILSASIMLDGTILGVDDAGNLWTRQNAAYWLPVPNSGPVASVSVAPDGIILGVTPGHQIQQRDSLYTPWIPWPAFPPSPAMLDVMQIVNKAYLGVTTNNALYTRPSMILPWAPVTKSGTPVLITGITQRYNGSYLGVGVDQQVYTSNSLPTSWNLVPDSGSVIAVKELVNSTFAAVDADNRLCISSTLDNWETGIVPGTPALLDIAQLPDGTLLGVTTQNELTYVAEPPAAWIQTNWNLGQTFLSVVQLQDSSLLGVGSMDNNLYAASAPGQAWTAVPANGTLFLSIAQMLDGTLLGVTTGHELATCPEVGGTWNTITGSGSARSAIQLQDSTIASIGLDGQLYTAPAVGATSWTLVPGSGTMRTVAQQQDATLLAIGQNTSIWQGRYSHLLGNIQHVVVLMLENRGFDTVLGYLYQPGQEPAHNIPPLTENETAFYGVAFAEPSALQNAVTIDNRTYVLSPSYPVRATDAPGTDPFEEYEHVNAQLFGPQSNPVEWTTPTMQGFLADFAGRFKQPDTAEIFRIEQIMKMYTPADLPVLSTLARSYAVSDRWFSSVPTQTNANRAFSLAGTSLGEVNNGMYLSGIFNSVFQIDSFRTETIFNVLYRSGFTDWGIFYAGFFPVVDTNRHAYTWNTFPFISEYIPDAESYFHTIDDFIAMAEKGTLPAYSYLEPGWGGAVADVLFNGTDYHPPADTMQGELKLKQLFEALQKNTAAWAGTLFVVTFDEHGGTYDHVAPPWLATPPWGKGRPSFPLQHGFRFNRFGVRIPTLLISPLIAEQTVFRSLTDVPYDHTSVIATILDWLQVDKLTWNLGARVAAAPTFDNVVTLTTPRTDHPFVQPAPPVGTPMNYGQPFLLVNANGTVLAKADPGAAYYFARLESAGGVAHSFRLGYGPLLSGKHVQIFTSQVLSHKFNVGDPLEPNEFFAETTLATALSAFHDRHYCYYYPTRDHAYYREQIWTIQKVGGNPGDPILYGDSVNLINEHFKEGLAASGADVTTESGLGDVWKLTPV